MKAFVLLAAVAFLALGAGRVSAAPTDLPTTGEWQQFFWGENPFPAIDDPEEGFLLTTSQAVYLDVADIGVPGDSFSLQVNDILFDTPDVAFGNTVILDPNITFLDAAYSSGRFVLLPGTYNITISLLATNPGGGSGYIRSTPTPEPFSMLLLGTGLVGIGGVMRRKQRAAVAE
ncbi:MAG TPA: PEP-CTERM sorting domain-containing protein [Pyrinomonadaceae bacterium]|nr:PEP-CTERM sorting domain-containing protein [Pyrinomonadaceae bacterium]